MQQDEKAAHQPVFAAPADRQAWLNDFGAFGTAILNADGKHVPLDGLIIQHQRLTPAECLAKWHDPSRD